MPFIRGMVDGNVPLWIQLWAKCHLYMMIAIIEFGALNFNDFLNYFLFF